MFFYIILFVSFPLRSIAQNQLCDLEKPKLQIIDDSSEEYEADKFEGDMDIPESEYRSLDGKVAILDRRRLWPLYTVPYIIDPDSNFTDAQINILERSIDKFNRYSCLQIIPKEFYHFDYVSVQNTDQGCYSAVGRTGGRQKLNLSNGCFKFGTIIHEFLHAMGMYHMQSAINRDDYVEICLENISKSYNEF